MDPVVVVDENDTVIGTMPKAEAHMNGTPHRVAATYVVSGKGEILVQIRISGIFDHSSAGHVHPEESYLEAARRELSEELGINGVELIRIGHAVSRNELSDKGENRTHVFDIFKCYAEPGALEAKEVKGVYWADPRRVLEDMRGDASKFTGGFQATLPVYLESL